MSKNNKHILRVVEENADGCDTNIEVYVGFSSELNDTILKEFQKHLFEAKERAAILQYDTCEEMVQVAIEEFNNSSFAEHISAKLRTSARTVFTSITV